MLREKIAFKKQLDQTILNKNPIVNLVANKHISYPRSNKSYSLGTEQRTKQHSSDINNMKAILNHNGFKANPLSSLKQHLLSKVPQKMEIE